MNINKENKWIDAYCNEVGDLLKNTKVQEMKNYPHHGHISTHFHSVFVSYTFYKASSAIGVRNREAVRASLLHDFYLYDWHVTKHEENHALYHPKAAVNNIEHYLGNLTDEQRNMILCHMWPIRPLEPPDSVDGFLLTLTDKYCANRELCGLSKNFLPIYKEILRRGES